MSITMMEKMARSTIETTKFLKGIDTKVNDIKKDLFNDNNDIENIKLLQRFFDQATTAKQDEESTGEKIYENLPFAPQILESETGEQFEEKIADFLIEFYTRCQDEGLIDFNLGQQLEKENIWIGPLHVNIPTPSIQMDENVLKQILAEQYTRFAKEIMGKTESEYMSVQGKIDIAGLNFTITAQETNDLTRVLTLLQSSMSLKMRKGFSVKIAEKNSNFYRAYATILLSAEPNIELINDQFWRMMQCFFGGNPDHSAHVTSIDNKQYIYRIRLLYELSGYGQQYIQSMAPNQAKYVLLLKGKHIYVMSMQQILSYYFDSDVLKSRLTSKDMRHVMYDEINVTINPRKYLKN